MRCWDRILIKKPWEGRGQSPCRQFEGTLDGHSDMVSHKEEHTSIQVGIPQRTGDEGQGEASGGQ